MFTSVLVANRGEVAVRIIRTLRRLGVRSIAVYSDADVDAPHVERADMAIRLGPAPAAQSYLSIEKVLAAAREAGAQAIHPGYGFLAENPDFASACAEHGIVYIGPPVEALQRLGDKSSAKLLAQAAGVPVLPGLQGPGLTDNEILAFAEADSRRLPLMIKASAGGGGRGMRIVRDLAQLPEALGAARREAEAGFGDNSLLVERYVERARHIEVQLLADAHGTVLYLGERECTLQRRHQKVVEESPSPVVTEAGRRRLGEAAVALAVEAGYVGVGTAEFLMAGDDPDDIAFLEVNARLQVEHPVTEAVTGLDLVEQQLLAASGTPLAISQEDVVLTGHSVEVRVCAEDPAVGFLPASGTVYAYREPVRTGIRVDSGIRQGSTIGSDYDSLLAKIIATGHDRTEALDRLRGALDELRILGVTTNTGFLARLIALPAVRAGNMDTGLIERDEAARLPAREKADDAAVAAAALEMLALQGHGQHSGDPWESLVGFRLGGVVALDWEFVLDGFDSHVDVRTRGESDRAVVTVDDGPVRTLRATPTSDGRLLVAVDGEVLSWDHAAHRNRHFLAAGADTFVVSLVEPVLESTALASEGAIEAPMPGTVLDVRVGVGAVVSAGQVLVVIESMKMELSITAPAAATVAEVGVTRGDGVKQGQTLVVMEATA
jgi:acetyl-CoA/propionyl-CoA carboxylase, biotin carboxylase, biotin carboxyl carrier protein